MNRARIRPAVAAAAFSVCLSAATSASAQPNRAPLPLEPLGARGEAIFPAFEGWGPHKDGSIVLLLGYYNRNKGESVDIPTVNNVKARPTAIALAVSSERRR